VALTFHLDIVSAEALVFSGPARQVVVPGKADCVWSWRATSNRCEG